MYVIEIEVGEDIKYLAVDANSGGYRYWSRIFGHALILTTLSLAEEELTSSCFTRNMEVGDGNLFPPRLIHMGLNLGNTHRHEKGTISIKKIDLKMIKHRQIESDLIVGYCRREH